MSSGMFDFAPGLFKGALEQIGHLRSARPNYWPFVLSIHSLLSVKKESYSQTFAAMIPPMRKAAPET